MLSVIYIRRYRKKAEGISTVDISKTVTHTETTQHKI